MSIFEKVKDIVIGQLQVMPEEVRGDSKLVQDLGADSLDMVEITMTIDEQFGVGIPDYKIPEMKTINDLKEYIQQAQK